MAAIIHRTPWTRQPQVPAQLRRNVGEAIVTFGATYLQAVAPNQAVGAVPTSIGNHTIATTAGGFGVHLTANNANPIKYSNSGVIPASRADFVVISAATISSDSRRQAIFFYGDESGTPHAQHTLSPNTDGVGNTSAGTLGAWTFSTSYLNSAQTDNTVIDGKYHVFAWRNGSNAELSLWLDGVNRTSTKTGGTSTLASSYETNILQTNIPGNNRGIRFPVHGVWVLLGRVSDELMHRLTTNPWGELYYPLSRRIYVGPSAAAGGIVGPLVGGGHLLTNGPLVDGRLAA